MFIKIGMISTILKFGKQNVKFLILFIFAMLLYNPYSINILSTILIIPVIFLIIFCIIVKHNIFINITIQPYMDLMTNNSGLNLDLFRLLDSSKTLITSALSFDNSFFLSILDNYLSYPLFLLFGLFFLLSTITSFFLLSYLGLYGVYLLNLISLCKLRVN